MVRGAGAVQRALASRLIEEKNGRFQLAYFYPPYYRRTKSRIAQAQNEIFLVKFKVLST